MDHSNGLESGSQGAVLKEGKGWWARVDFDVLDRWRREGLNAPERSAMLALSKYARFSYVAFPSNEVLGEDLGSTGPKGFKPMGDRGIAKMFKRLAKLGKIHVVYRDRARKDRAGIVLLDRESDSYPVPTVPKEGMSAAWVDAVKGKDCRVRSSESDGTPVPCHRNSSSCTYGTPVPQNKDLVNKDKEEINNPPYPPKTSSERNGRSGGFVGSFFLRDDPGVRKEDRRTQISSKAIDHIGRYFGDEVGKELASSQSRLINAAGSVLAAHAAITATLRSDGDIAVRKPVGLMISKAGQFAKEGVPAEMIATEDLALAGVEGR